MEGRQNAKMTFYIVVKVLINYCVILQAIKSIFLVLKFNLIG